MKVKTSISLSEEIVALIDEHSEGEKNRSAFIERAIRTYLEVIGRKRRDQEDLASINRLSEKLNREALDVLEYQLEHGT